MTREGGGERRPLDCRAALRGRCGERRLASGHGVDGALDGRGRGDRACSRACCLSREGRLVAGGCQARGSCRRRVVTGLRVSLCVESLFFLSILFIIIIITTITAAAATSTTTSIVVVVVIKISSQPFPQVDSGQGKTWGGEIIGFNFPVPTLHNVTYQNDTVVGF